jgi:Raf kinase inhibitor-like YbhB/YbcL family protein
MRPQALFSAPSLAQLRGHRTTNLSVKRSSLLLACIALLVASCARGARCPTPAVPAVAPADARWLSGTSPAPSTFVVRSTAFGEGQTLPDSTVLKGLDCAGANASPPIEWANAPAGTRGFVLVMDDFEARGGDGFVHWAVYNIPPTVTSVPANAGTTEGDLSGFGRHAYNDFLRKNYGGPCPPEGPPHKYRFTVYAVDLPSIDDAGTPMTWRKLRFIIRDHVLGQASLTGLRGHSLASSR